MIIKKAGIEMNLGFFNGVQRKHAQSAKAICYTVYAKHPCTPSQITWGQHTLKHPVLRLCQVIYISQE